MGHSAMMRVAGIFVLTWLRYAIAEEDFQDTPLLSSLWQAVSSKDNDAVDRLFDSSSFAISARASDGRGPIFWAWEFQNAYALGSIIAAGGDPMSTDEDLQGSTAVSMCETNPDCSKDDLLAEAKGMVDDIKKRKEEREKAADDLDSDDDFDSDSEASSGSAGSDDDEF